MASAGILVSPPDINKSGYTFSPDKECNSIRYGLKGINKVSKELCDNIITNRPYISIEDFYDKVKLNKPQMLNLIKSGSFDKFGDREQIVHDYIDSISDKKSRLTLQNMKMLLSYDLLPKDLEKEKAIYNFNLYLKKNCKKQLNYCLADYPLQFFERYFDTDILDYSSGYAMIKCTDWDKIYKKSMNPMREYLKDHQQDLLKALNNALFRDAFEKNALGTISKWEMDSLSFYYHKHELADIDSNEYNFVDFYKLKENPSPETFFHVKDSGKEIPIYHIYRIAGTVLDKNKNKSSITLLTTTGVVQVKMFGSVFNTYDRQISQKDDSGKKKVLEKSWFTRGNKIAICGIRNGDTFIAKKYKKTIYPLVELITNIDENGELEFMDERVDVEC